MINDCARTLRVVFSIAFATFASAAPALAQVGAPGCASELASVGQNNVLSNDDSDGAGLAADGRTVIFSSVASNLVPGGTSGNLDVFVHDRWTATTRRVSVNSSGALGDDFSFGCSLSASGRIALFESDATNLVDGDTNARTDVFVHDLSTGITRRASVASDGTEGNDSSRADALSADGTRVAFTSGADNLAPGDANTLWDVYVHDLTTGKTVCASLTPAGVAGNGNSGRGNLLVSIVDLGVSLSSDGRLLAFASEASDLVAGDTNQVSDIFVRDLELRTTRLVTVGLGGVPAAGPSAGCELAPDGSRVVFHSYASNLVSGNSNGRAAVFLCDLATGTFERRSFGVNGAQPDADCVAPSLSADGRFVAFESRATNLVPGDTNGTSDVFVNDALSHTTARASVTYLGSQTFLPAYGAHLSSSGQFLLFTSAANGLVLGDNNGRSDAILRDCTSVFASAYCNGKVTSLGCMPVIGCSGTPSASGSGVFFVAAAPVLNAKTGVLMYGTNGRSALPFQGGTLCVADRVQRTPQVWSGGNPPGVNDCSGALRLDMNAFSRGALGGSPANALSVAGTVVDCQWWSFDPGHVSTAKSAMSNALEYLVLP